MRKLITSFTVLLACFGLVNSPNAQTAEISRSTLVVNLSQCRNVADAAIRLACYDRAAEALDQGEKSGEVVVIERTQVQAARRDLFGFSMPALPNLFARNGEAEQLDSIETSLLRASQMGDGKWVFHLSDQSEWRQIDSMPVRFRNRSGETVRVRNAALGSYLMTIGASRAVRVRRQ